MERRRILLIDDNPHDVELALSAFQEGGDEHDVVVAGSGAEALAALRCLDRALELEPQGPAAERTRAVLEELRHRLN